MIKSYNQERTPYIEILKKKKKKKVTTMVFAFFFFSKNVESYDPQSHLPPTILYRISIRQPWEDQPSFSRFILFLKI